MSVYGKDNTAFFKEALLSVSLKQTLKPSQIVIVEDGPVPAETEMVIKDVTSQIPECEFTIIRKAVNAGLAAALNSGLKACKYEWIARMDSDDISRPDRFEKQFNYINLHPETDCIGGAIAEFHDTPGDMQSERHVGLNEKEIREMAKSRTPMNHVTVMYRKSTILNIGGYCENFGKLEDYKLWVDMLSAGYHAANLPDIIVDVRVGNGFIERRSNKREIEDWDNLQRYLLNAGFISHIQALLNKFYIRLFIYTPPTLKQILYKHILRK